VSITRNFVLALSFWRRVGGAGGRGHCSGVEYNPASFSAGMASVASPSRCWQKLIRWYHPAIFGVRCGMGQLMQLQSEIIPVNTIQYCSTLVIVFVAADQIVRWICHYSTARRGQAGPWWGGW